MFVGYNLGLIMLSSYFLFTASQSTSKPSSIHSEFDTFRHKMHILGKISVKVKTTTIPKPAVTTYPIAEPMSSTISKLVLNFDETDSRSSVDFEFSVINKPNNRPRESEEEIILSYTDLEQISIPSQMNLPQTDNLTTILASTVNDIMADKEESGANVSFGTIKAEKDVIFTKGNTGELLVENQSYCADCDNTTLLLQPPTTTTTTMSTIETDTSVYLMYIPCSHALPISTCCSMVYKLLVLIVDVVLVVVFFQ